ncbi:MAG: hypothetical protein ABW298_10975 [Candidatus Binatia bacterium]
MGEGVRGPSLQFAGGAGTVTGSKYVLRVRATDIARVWRRDRHLGS